MNPITQMMECYGVEKHFAYLECHRGTSIIGCPLMDEEKDDGCQDCVNANKMKRIVVYPPFTAKKQIELIKYIMKAPNTDELRMYYSEILKCYVFHWYSLPELDMRASYSTQNTNYDFALAELVTRLKDELEHQQVMEILQVEEEWEE